MGQILTDPSIQKTFTKHIHMYWANLETFLSELLLIKTSLSCHKGGGVPNITPRLATCVINFPLGKLNTLELST